MGGHSSKNTFTEWDLIEFSNVTGKKYLTILFIIIYKKFCQ
jgi:hypothetical protein